MSKQNRKAVERIVITALNHSTRSTNYKILSMLPSDINSITKVLKITSINVNKHVNELERMGLVVRERGTGKVDLTELSEKILRLIERLETEVSINLWKYKTGNTH